MTDLSDLTTPWSLHFDRDGTEDVAIVCDAELNDLARSRHFWLPEEHDPIPKTLIAIRMMTAAPDLFEALEFLLEQTVNVNLEHAVPLSRGEQVARLRALKAIKKARES